MDQFRKKTAKELASVLVILLLVIFLGQPVFTFLAKYVLYWGAILILAFIAVCLIVSLVKGKTYDEWID